MHGRVANVGEIINTARWDLSRVHRVTGVSTATRKENLEHNRKENLEHNYDIKN